MADPQWLMGALAADDAYRGDDPPWPPAPGDVPEPTGMGSVLGMGALMPPPRNPAAPPQGVVDMFVPNLSRSETYAPRSAELQPNAAGKVPTSDPLTTGAAADFANIAGYAIPGPGGAAKVSAAVLGLGAGRRLVPKMGDLADPQLWSPLSNTKLRKPLSEYEHQYTDVRSPVPKFVDPQTMVGGHLILTPWDLSAANRTATHIGGVKLDRPVPAHGGVGFPEANPGMAAASEMAIARRLDNQARGLADLNARNLAAGKGVAITPAYHLGRPSASVPASQYLDNEWLDGVMRRLEADAR